MKRVGNERGSEGDEKPNANEEVVRLKHWRCLSSIGSVEGPERGRTDER